MTLLTSLPSISTENLNKRASVRYQKLCQLIISLGILNIAHVANAGLLVDDPSWQAVTRATGVSAYPITVDSSGDVYFVTGTSYSDKLEEVTTSGAINVITPATGAVVGTVANLEFGFGGNLYAPVGAPGYEPRGIEEFSLPGGTTSMLWNSDLQSGDAGMAFDPSKQLMYVSVNQTGQIMAVNAVGNATVVASPPTGGFGLALESNGNLLLMSGGGQLYNINPTSNSVTPTINLGALIPDASQFKSMDIDPLNGKIFFSVEMTASTTTRDLYSINPDGTGLNLIAQGGAGTGVDGPLQIKFGAAGDGSGNTSLYLDMNESQQIIELRNVNVPEPSSIVLLLFGSLGIFSLLGVQGYRKSRLGSYENRA